MPRKIKKSNINITISKIEILFENILSDFYNVFVPKCAKTQLLFAIFESLWSRQRFIQESSWHLRITGQCLLVGILHLIYKVCRMALLIVTFSIVRTLFDSTYRPRPLRSADSPSFSFFFDRILSTSSSALLANKTLNSPSFGRTGFR